MLMCFALLVVAIVAGSGSVSGDETCRLQGTTVKDFNTKNVPMKVPCKYNAVRDTHCGIYKINVSPGNIFVGKQFRLDTIWLGIVDTDSSNEWQGRTSNKKAVKFFNGNTTELFKKKRGNLDTSEVLTYSINNKKTVAAAINGDFEVTFTPWDPDNSDFKKSEWSFTCHNDTFVPSIYPKQMCGSTAYTKALKTRTEELGLEGLPKKADAKQLAVYYDIFNETQSDISQTDERCKEAEEVFQNNCTDHESRKDAIVACGQILDFKHYRNCAVKYSCNPMDVFVECLKWACSGFTDDIPCENLGRSIDLCREFRDGNLTRKMEDANCYTDFLAIYD